MPLIKATDRLESKGDGVLEIESGQEKTQGEGGGRKAGKWRRKFSLTHLDRSGNCSKREAPH